MYNVIAEVFFLAYFTGNLDALICMPVIHFMNSMILSSNRG